MCDLSQHPLKLISAPQVKKPWSRPWPSVLDVESNDCNHAVNLARIDHRQKQKHNFPCISKGGNRSEKDIFTKVYWAVPQALCSHPAKFLDTSRTCSGSDVAGCSPGRQRDLAAFGRCRSWFVRNPYEALSLLVRRGGCPVVAYHEPSQHTNYMNAEPFRCKIAHQWRAEGARRTGRRPRASKPGGHPKSKITKI